MGWPSDLRSLQARFLALVTSAEGVPGELARLGASAADLAGLVVGDEKLDGVGRVGIYSDMYLERLHDAVAEDYPKLAALLGEEAFAALVGDFLAAWPPASYALRDLGAPLADFLAAGPGFPDRPWLAELARLEWSRVDLFDGPDAATLTLDRLRSLPPDRFAELPLVLVPGQRLLPVRFTVEEVWRRVDRDEPAGAPELLPGHLLVWRKHTEVLHRRPSPEEAGLLAALAPGGTFGLVCDRLGAGRPAEEAAGAALQFLVDWAEQGLLAQPPNELE